MQFYCMVKLKWQQAKFIKSCPANKHLPPDEGIEIAFAGRSNAGKSSLLNALTKQKNLAKSSSKPGKTREINLFDLGSNIRLSDLPGYGYAKVSMSEKKRWGIEMTKYIEERKCLKAIILLMDIRHPLTELDRQMIELIRNSGNPFLIVLNKSDKIKKNQIQNTVKKVETELTKMGSPTFVFPVSSEKRIGLEKIKELLEGWT